MAKKTKVLFAALYTLALVAPLVLTRSVLALGSVYLSPSSASVAHGSNLTINLRINPGTAVTVVQAVVNFDPAKLQYVSLDASASPFDTSVSKTIGSNSISISRAVLDPAGVSGDSLVASITFMALPYSGNTSITVSSANAAFNGSYTNPGTSGSTITFTPGNCPSGQTGTPPNCSTPTKTTTKTSTPSTSTTTPPTTTSATPAATPATLDPPTITSQVFQYTTGKINVHTGQTAQVSVKYGLSQDSLSFQSALTASGTDHTVTINDLPAGTNLFYIVVAQNGQTTSQTDVQTVHMKGLSVKVVLQDADLKPITNQAISLKPSDRQAKTDSHGFVVLDDLAPGDYILSFTVGNQTYSQHLGVLANIDTAGDGTQTAKQQTQSLIFDSYKVPADSFTKWLWPAVGVVSVAAAAAAVVLWRKGRLHFTWPHRTRSSGDVIPNLVVGAQTPVNPIVVSQVTNSNIHPPIKITPEVVSPSSVNPTSHEEGGSNVWRGF